jgi:hypothetical protein
MNAVIYAAFSHFGPAMQTQYVIGTVHPFLQWSQSSDLHIWCERLWACPDLAAIEQHCLPHDCLPNGGMHHNISN